jgi:hypothetical protein
MSSNRGKIMEEDPLLEKKKKNQNQKQNKETNKIHYYTLYTITIYTLRRQRCHYLEAHDNGPSLGSIRHYFGNTLGTKKEGFILK